MKKPEFSKMEKSLGLEKDWEALDLKMKSKPWRLQVSHFEIGFATEEDLLVEARRRGIDKPNYYLYA